NQLARLGEKTRAEVIERIDARLGDADKRRFDALAATEPPAGTEVVTPEASDAETTDREMRDVKALQAGKEGKSGGETKDQGAGAKTDAGVKGEEGEAEKTNGEAEGEKAVAAETNAETNVENPGAEKKKAGAAVAKVAAEKSGADAKKETGEAKEG